MKPLKISFVVVKKKTSNIHSKMIHTKIPIIQNQIIFMNAYHLSSSAECFAWFKKKHFTVVVIRARTISVPTRSHFLFLLFFCNDICIHSMCLKRDFVESVCVFQAFDGTSFDDRSDFWRTHSKALASKKNH